MIKIKNYTLLVVFMFVISIFIYNNKEIFTEYLSRYTWLKITLPLIPVIIAVYYYINNNKKIHIENKEDNDN
jgi:hypothetical protein